MGNANQMSQQSSSGIKKKLPFYSREDDYSPLGDDNEFGKKIKCTLKTRLMGFAVCCGVGWLFSILGTISLILRHDVVIFSILYSLGQMINITGSCFLATPQKQFKSMTHTTRLLLTCIYLGMIVVTITLAFVLPENLTFLVFLSLIGQMIAYFFYTLSYIPYGQKILKKICRFMVE